MEEKKKNRNLLTDNDKQTFEDIKKLKEDGTIEKVVLFMKGQKSRIFQESEKIKSEIKYYLEVKGYINFSNTEDFYHFLIEYYEEFYNLSWLKIGGFKVNDNDFVLYSKFREIMMLDPTIKECEALLKIYEEYDKRNNNKTKYENVEEGKEEKDLTAAQILLKIYFENGGKIKNDYEDKLPFFKDLGDKHSMSWENIRNGYDRVMSLVELKIIPKENQVQLRKDLTRIFKEVDETGKNEILNFCKEKKLNITE